MNEGLFLILSKEEIEYYKKYQPDLFKGIPVYESEKIEEK